LVTLRNTTDGRISRSEILLVAGTSRLVRKTKNFPREALICLSRTLPGQCQELRVRGGIMGKKETPYGTTQSPCDTG
jgi:hypothetical protein